MTTDWRDIFCRMIDGDAIDEPDAEALAEALHEDNARREALRWLQVEAGLRTSLGASNPPSAVSRERLLAKALLRERALDVRTRVARLRRRVALLAAAAAILVAVGLSWRFVWGRHGEIQIEGDAKVFRQGVSVQGVGDVRRGDRIIAGPAEASLVLGGYCHLELKPNCEIVIAGLPRKEVIDLEVGRVASRVDPNRGHFTVRTVLGTINVTGTEFVTTVVCPETKGNVQMSPSMKRLSTTVTVAVIAGSVACHFSDETGVLSGGMSQVFGAEEAGGVPDGMRGFCGILQGKIVGKTDNGFALQVEKVGKTWRNNKAKNPAACVGKQVSLRLHPKGKHVREQLGKMTVGDSVVTGAANREGNVLTVVELLVKAEEYPALLAKWEAAARKRKERSAPRREKAAADRPDGLGGFCGILQGKIVEKGENGFALQIEKVEKTWKNNKAKNPEASVGKKVSLRLHPRGKHVREQLGKMKVGDTVVTGAINREGNVLTVVELLVKADEYPALQAKWERQRKEREARQRKDRERRESDRD